MAQPRKRQSSRAKLPGYLLFGLFVSVLLMVISFSYASIQTSRYNTYISITEQFQILALQLLKHSTEASKAKERSFTFLEESRNQFDQHLDRLVRGDELLTPSPPAAQSPLNALQSNWREYASHVQDILDTEGVVRLQNEFVIGINEIMPDLIDFSDRVAKELIDKGAHKRQIYLASRQLMLGQRIATNVNRLMVNNKFAAASAKQFEDDTKEFGKVLFGLVGGDKNLRLKRVRENEIRDQLDQLLLIYETVDIMVKRILEKTPTLFKAQSSADALVQLSDNLIDSISLLREQYNHLKQELDTIRLVGFILGIVSVVILVMLTIRLNAGTRLQLEVEAVKNKRTQQAILRLLDEIAPVAEGDLRAKATVTEEVTGAIADAINFTIEALRELVTTIDMMAKDVLSSAEDTQVMSLQLTRASEQQSQQIESVNQHIETIAAKMTATTTNAEESLSTARHARSTAEQGSVAVKETIDSMHVIVDDIRESSARVKRLGETSQEIGDIVELINDIAEQTNLLALNAAIKASTAGEGGAAFTGIADEVQQLAERVSQATQKIESLVTNIQLDTAKAVESMEQSTGDVLSGAKLAELAGASLSSMETVSAQLMNFIHNVTSAARELNILAEQTRQDMATIKKVANQTVAGTRQAAILAGELADKASHQIQGIKSFSLPGDNDEKNS